VIILSIHWWPQFRVVSRGLPWKKRLDTHPTKKSKGEKLPGLYDFSLGCTLQPLRRIQKQRGTSALRRLHDPIPPNFANRAEILLE
jgi:hypothetical protein